jgi:predicted DNA repair protein MutK
VAVLVGIAVLMTLGVYGLVAGIVKLDDLGLWLSGRASSAARALGRGIVAAAPWLMKGLSVAGTAAMFLVGGGIVVHGVPALHHAVEAAGQAAAGAWPLGGLWAAVLPHVLNALAGMAVGAAVLAAWTLLGRLRGR